MNAKINESFQERRSQTLLECGFSKQPQLRSLAGRSRQLKYQHALYSLESRDRNKTKGRWKKNWNP